MKNLLADTINNLLTRYEVTDINGLSQVLEKNPALVSQICESAASGFWVYFSKNTYDGWYCVPTETSPIKYEVYYQERGRIDWGQETYTNQHDAVASVLFKSGYLDFLRKTNDSITQEK